MFPQLFSIGPVTFHTYGLLVALGALAGIKITIILAARDGYNQKGVDEALYSLLLYVVISGLFGARLLYILVHWHEFSGDLAGIFMIWQGGLVSYGGLAGGLFGISIWHTKNRNIPLRNLLDWIAPSIALAHALGRLGCFSAGCCYGRTTHSILGVIFTHPQSLAPLGFPLHPTQLYEFIFLIFLGLYLLQKFKPSERIKGLLFADYLSIYSTGRFVIGFFRGDDPRFWGLTPGQIASILTLIASLFIRSYLKRTQQI